MNNIKRFTGLLLLLLSGILFLFGCKSGTEKNDVKLYTWIHADAEKTAEAWDKDFAGLEQAGFTGILIGANPEVLKRAIPEAKKHHLEVHAWMWTMNRGDADTSWLSVNQKGQSLATHKAYVGYYKFMCPALPEVKTFLKSKIDKLAAIEGLDGIHMDYIRYVDAILPIELQPKYGLQQDSVFPEFDYGYHPYMVKLYKDSTGIDPFDLKNPATDPGWLQFRLEQLNQTVRELRDHIRGYDLEATAAVFPTPAMAREMVRQEWNRWNLDGYFPMVYHNFYNENTGWITQVMQEDKAVIPENEKVICGLYVPALNSPEKLHSAMNAAMEGGADGIAFFEFNTLTPEMLKMIRKF